MKAAILLSLLAYSGLPLAMDAGQAAQTCGALLTEAECQQHRQTLAHLDDPVVRQVYLEEHMALLREREVMCASRPERQYLARALYR